MPGKWRDSSYDSATVSDGAAGHQDPRNIACAWLATAGYDAHALVRFRART